QQRVDACHKLLQITAGITGALRHHVPHFTRPRDRLRVQCLTAEACALDHKGQRHQKIRERDHFRVPKSMFEESLDMKTDDTRQAPHYQSLSPSVLWPQASINPPGLIAIGKPYPQPAGKTKQPPFRCYLDDIVV